MLRYVTLDTFLDYETEIAFPTTIAGPLKPLQAAKLESAFQA
jgi:hypothetical protein